MSHGLPTGVIEDVAVLDLTSMVSPEELAGITEIRDVATILIRESLLGGLTAIPMRDVASVVPVVDGARVQMHTGSLVVGGEALAAPGAEDGALVVTGSLILTSPVERVAYRQIVVTGLVLAPRGSESAVLAGLTRVTGSVDFYRYAEGQQIKMLSGQTKISGEALANSGGSRDDILIIAGQVIVTGPVPAVGYARIFALGQILAPRASEAVLGPATTIMGQVAWYDGQPRFFVGRQRFGQGFFELLDEPLALGLIGSFEIDPEVAPQLLRERISDILLFGKITASTSVVPVLQLLTTECHGRITTYEDAGEQG